MINICLKDLSTAELLRLQKQIEKEREERSERSIAKGDLLIDETLWSLFKPEDDEALANAMSKAKKSVFYLCDLTLGNYERRNYERREYKDGHYANNKSKILFMHGSYLIDVDVSAYKAMTKDILEIIEKYLKSQNKLAL